MSEPAAQLAPSSRIGRLFQWWKDKKSAQYSELLDVYCTHPFPISKKSVRDFGDKLRRYGYKEGPPGGRGLWHFGTQPLLTELTVTLPPPDVWPKLPAKFGSEERNMDDLSPPGTMPHLDGMPDRLLASEKSVEEAKRAMFQAARHADELRKRHQHLVDVERWLVWARQRLSTFNSESVLEALVQAANERLKALKK